MADYIKCMSNELETAMRAVHRLAKVLDYNMVYSQGLPNDKKVG